MKLKGVVMEDFVNYKKPSLFLISSVCDWKCCKEANIDVSICQNNSLSNRPMIDVSDKAIYEAYRTNPITKAIVIGGLEPMIQIEEVVRLIELFRENGCNDEFVIYTGYYPEEIPSEIERLRYCKNVIVKFGRYIPNKSSIFNNILGVTLASDNQYAEVIS